MKESRSSPLILFIKDIEKSVLANPEAYASFKSKLEKLPWNVVVIVSHAQMDTRKDKVRDRHQQILYCHLSIIFIF